MKHDIVMLFFTHCSSLLGKLYTMGAKFEISILTRVNITN